VANKRADGFRKIRCAELIAAKFVALKMHSVEIPIKKKERYSLEKFVKGKERTPAESVRTRQVRYVVVVQNQHLQSVHSEFWNFGQMVVAGVQVRQITQARQRSNIVQLIVTDIQILQPRRVDERFVQGDEIVSREYGVPQFVPDRTEVNARVRT
jgi:hypothetical protein